MKSRRMRTFKPGDRIKAKNDAKKILREVAKISRRLLSLETISDIRDGVDKLETGYRMAAQKSVGDDRLYAFINKEAVNKFTMIACYVEQRFGPGELLSKIERYKSRHIPIY